MKKEFKPIAMKCNQEQFDAVKYKLEKAGINIETEHFCEWHLTPYLTNNLVDIKNNINNINESDAKRRGREIHETWNKKVFLEACGIEVEEPKVNILTLSEPIGDYVIFNGKKYVPEVVALEPEKKELVVEAGKWYKYPDYQKWNLYVAEVDEENKIVKGYGFGTEGNWMENATNDSWDFEELEKCIEMTQQEVEEALKAEAVRRGFKVGSWIKWDGYEGQITGDIYWASGSECISAPCNPNTTKRYNENFPLMLGGVWAELLPVKKMTQAEIETELGYKIEIV